MRIAIALYILLVIIGYDFGISNVVCCDVDEFAGDDDDDDK
ncbi:MAG: hypothetical protein PHT03_03200 [Bacilli bacterium]|nr:hypothetical protein [Bacilli bacterium]